MHADQRRAARGGSRVATRVTLLGALAIGSLAAFPHAAWAQDPFAGIHEMLKARESRVEEWLLLGRVELAITLAVGIFGIATTALQGHRWAKRAAVAFGLLISILTLVKTTVFKQDHHAFFRAHRRGVEHLELARDKLLQAMGFPADSLDAARDEVRKEILAIDRIADALDGAPAGGAPRTAQIGLVAAAHARVSGDPAWIQEPPKSDKVHVWVVAHGQGRTLQEAREAAAADSADVLERTFLRADSVRGVSEADIKNYREALLAAVVEEATHYTYDPARQTFDYHRLLRLRRETLESTVRFSALSTGEQLPANTIQWIQTAKPSSDVVAVPRASADMLLQVTRETLPDEDWRAFSDGRYARLSGDNARAAEILERLVADHPATYLAQLNLGLAYDRMGRVAPAEAAYRAALALEPSLPARDAAIYNTLGYFLYRQQRYAEAAPLLERALALDPEHAKARRTLAATKQSLVRPIP